MTKRKLPDRGTAEAEDLIAIYPMSTQTELEGLAAKYGYSCKATFQDAMYRRLGTRRLGSIATQPSVPVIRISEEPLTLQTPKGDRKMVAIIGDTQHPFHDAKSLAVVEQFLEELQPDYLFYNGDMQDFYQISKFDKDPRRITEMQSDIDSTRAMFRHHKVILPNTDKKLLGGNHEDRLQKFLWTKASEFSSLQCLSISELFHLEEYEIDYIPYECGVMINDVFLIIHGSFVSAHSSYTAKRMFERHGGCGICNHSHRGGTYYKRNRFGVFGWWENFCLCSLEPDWIRYPDWQQGFSLVHFFGKHFWVEQMPIIDHEFIYGGKLYK